MKISAHYIRVAMFIAVLAAATESSGSIYTQVFCRQLDRPLQMESATLAEALQLLLSALWETDPRLRTIDSTLFKIDLPNKLVAARHNIDIPKQSFGTALSEIAEAFGCRLTVAKEGDVIHVAKATVGAVGDFFILVPNYSVAIVSQWKPDENIRSWFEDRGVVFGSEGSAIYLG